LQSASLSTALHLKYLLDKLHSTKISAYANFATMGSVVLPHLVTSWHVDQAIMSEDSRLVVIRFGRDWDPDYMRQDEVLYRIADRSKISP
jgi:hypothetical protein